MRVLRLFFRAFFVFRYRVFISYSRRHEGLAHDIYGILVPGQTVFLDRICIRVGEDWQARLDDELNKCTHLYVLWCRHASESPHVAEEIETALRNKKKIVPIQIGDHPLSEALSKYQGSTKSFVSICTSNNNEPHSDAAIGRTLMGDLNERWAKDKARVRANRAAAASVVLFLGGGALGLTTYSDFQKQDNPQAPKSLVSPVNRKAERVRLEPIVPGQPKSVAVALDKKEKISAPVIGPNHRAESGAARSGYTFRDCRTCPAMVVVPAGSFIMGSPKSEKERGWDEGPQRRVRISKPFAVGKFEVTFGEWDSCVSAGGCKRRPDDSGWGRGNRPVIDVSWDDAQEYVTWLSSRTGKSYRLLTEAEWEYVARSGSALAYSWGNAIGKGNAVCRDCGSRWDFKQTAPVGSFKPNAFAVHDMHGNVWEWVQDCHQSYKDAPTDGSAVTSANCRVRVLRGGSWFVTPPGLRSAVRGGIGPDDRDGSIGFRVARTITP